MRLAVAFPGIGYHTDKPLLYYSKKIARQYGFETIDVPYGGFGDHVKGSPEKMREAFEHAFSQAEEILRDVEFGKYENILFISKSVGTAVAGAYAGKYALSTGNLYYTPVEQSFSVMDRQGVVFFGTGDPWTPVEKLEEGCRRKNFLYYEYEGANHSLETGNVGRDLQNLTDIMEKTKMYIAMLTGGR